MKDKLEYFGVKSLIYLANMLPQSWIYSFMKFLSRVIFRFEKRRNALTLKNLSLAFPEKDDKEIRKLAIQAYESVAITIAEILFMMNNKLDIDSLIINKEEVIEKLNNLKHKNGIIFITAHFGNWELAAQFLAKNGYPMTTIGRRGNNELIEKNLTTPFREKYGNKNIHKRNALITIIKTIKNDKNIGLMMDQKAGGRDSVRVKFFNKDADTLNAVALLQLKYDPLVIPMFSVREHSGKYKIKMYDPVKFYPLKDSNKDQNIKDLTQKYNDILEDIIKKHPEQWFWMHNRWRLPS